MKSITTYLLLTHTSKLYASEFLKKSTELSSTDASLDKLIEETTHHYEKVKYTSLLCFYASQS